MNSVFAHSDQILYIDPIFSLGGPARHAPPCPPAGPLFPKTAHDGFCYPYLTPTPLSAPPTLKLPMTYFACWPEAPRSYTPGGAVTTSLQEN